MPDQNPTTLDNVRPSPRGSHGPTEDLEFETAIESLLRAISRSPDSTAVISGQAVYSYRVLDQQSRQLSAILVDRGIAPGSRIGLCMERSFGLMVSMLAAWRSGASWVPLDPGYPAERLEFVANDAEIDLLIVSSLSKAAIDWPAESTLNLDADGTLPEFDPTSGEAGHLIRSSAADEAYAMYTSGSTGLPKGVSIPHRAVSNFLQSMAKTPGIRGSDRLLAVTTPSFDISILELLLPLTVGATVVIADRDDVRDGALLRDLILQRGITMMQATASTWRILIDAGWEGSKTLKALIGGEPLSPTLGTQLTDRCAEVWNMYGPTETTVWSSCWRVPGGTLVQVSLGTPVANTRVEIMDKDLKPCGAGVPGEIGISGLGVASGYIKRPDETRSRFISLPSRDPNYALLYRTGDLGQWGTDGSLQFMGRLDAQIKIRGRRIELGEIEERLRAHSEVSDATVTTREPSPGDVRLVAHVVGSGRTLDIEELYTFLGHWLPDYMIPQHIVELPALPLLDNGKLDRKRLAAIPLGSERATRPTSPRTPTESLIHEVWRDILKRDSIGIHENFFDIGGHSLLAAQAAERLRRVTVAHDEIPLIFSFPTIAALAAALDTRIETERHQLIPLQTDGQLPPLFCIGGIELFQALANEFAPHRPVFGVYVEAGSETPQDSGDSGTWPVTSVERLALEYATAIREQQRSGPYILVGFSFGGVIAHAVATLLERDGDKIALVGILDSDAPGDARQHPGFRARLWLKGMVSTLLAPGVPTDSDSGSAQSKEARNGDIESDEPPAGMSGVWRMLSSHQAPHYRGKIVFVEAIEERTDTSHGWQDLASEVLHVKLPTTHIGLLRQPHVAELAAILKANIRD